MVKDLLLVENLFWVLKRMYGIRHCRWQLIIQDFSVSPSCTNRKLILKSDSSMLPKFFTPPRWVRNIALFLLSLGLLRWFRLYGALFCGKHLPFSVHLAFSDIWSTLPIAYGKFLAKETEKIFQFFSVSGI